MQQNKRIGKKDKRNTFLNLMLRTIGLWGGLIIFIIAFFIDIFSYSNTSIYHLGGGATIIVTVVRMVQSFVKKV